MTFASKVITGLRNLSLQSRSQAQAQSQAHAPSQVPTRSQSQPQAAGTERAVVSAPPNHPNICETVPALQSLQVPPDTINGYAHPIPISAHVISPPKFSDLV
jgi:hypothetical protein